MAQLTIENSSINLQPQKVRKIFDLSIYLADLAEELLEEKAYYSKEFITGLRRAEKDFREGRVKKLKSLRDLR